MYTIYEPKSEVLSSYISEFTILKKDNFSPINYLAFPHSVSSIVFYSQTKFLVDKERLILSKTERKNNLIAVIGKYLSPLVLSYEHAVDEIGINFTELGINYFFEDNFDKIAGKPFQFLNNKEWSAFAKQLFEIEEGSRIGFLESFLLTQIKSKDLSQIKQVLELMENDFSIKVNEIALRMKVSAKTINRLFHKYIGCSPIAYKKILRFRSSVSMHSEQINLTELCLSNEYYDSPHFTNEFKKLTSSNPRDFFTQLTKVDNKEFPYVFI